MGWRRCKYINSGNYWGENGLREAIGAGRVTAATAGPLTQGSHSMPAAPAVATYRAHHPGQNKVLPGWYGLMVER